MNKILKNINFDDFEKIDNGLFIFSIGNKISNDKFNNSLTKEKFYNIVNLLKNDKYISENKVYKEYTIRNKYNNLNLYIDSNDIYYYIKKLIKYNIFEHFKYSFYEYDIIDINKYSQSNIFFSEKKINKTILKYENYYIEFLISSYEDNITTYEINLVCRSTKSGFNSLLSKFNKLKIDS